MFSVDFFCSSGNWQQRGGKREACESGKKESKNKIQLICGWATESVLANVCSLSVLHFLYYTFFFSSIHSGVWHKHGRVFCVGWGRVRKTHFSSLLVIHSFFFGCWRRHNQAREREEEMGWGEMEMMWSVSFFMDFEWHYTTSGCNTMWWRGIAWGERRSNQLKSNF